MKKTIVIICLCAGFAGKAQNVGIGTATPAAPLHLKATTAEVLRLESISPYISFYNGTGLYSGYLWYSNTASRMELGTPFLSNKPVVIAPNQNGMAYFTGDGRLGLGNSSPAERLDVNGNMNLTGLLKVNGSGGTAGQVLTSNGTADPAWKNTAYNNTTRFKVFLGEGATLNSNLNCSIIYNTNTTDVVINPASITINKTGLYHLEGTVSPIISFAAAPEYTPEYGLGLNISMGGNNPQVSMVLRRESGIATRFHGFEKFSTEVYIVAGSTITCISGFDAPGPVGSYGVAGYLRGHLINE